jgi:hypothetical protein
MNDHYHLLVETPDANLSKAMRDINGNYTQWFNTRHKSVGHIFQGRYKAFVIEKETYLLEVARYIVLNPVRSFLSTHPRNWKWSSYRYTAENHKPPHWLSIDGILSLFDREKKTARKQYRSFVSEGLTANNPYQNLTNGFLLGSPQFIHRIWESYTNGSEHVKAYPREQRVVGRPTLQEIFEGVTTTIERNRAIQFARYRCGYLNTEIANHLGLHWTTIGQITRKNSHL